MTEDGTEKAAPNRPTPLQLNTQEEEEQKTFIRTASALQAQRLNIGEQDKQGISQLDFDKDCDLHVSFVMAAANLRADNYGIQRTEEKVQVSEDEL